MFCGLGELECCTYRTWSKPPTIAWNFFVWKSTFTNATMAGRLRVRRPSPTTVSFTVSNAPSRDNTPAKILLGFQILLRAFLLFCVIVVGIAQAQLLFPEIDRWAPSWQPLWSSLNQTHVCYLVDTYNPWIIATVCALVVYGVFRRGYTGTQMF